MRLFGALAGKKVGGGLGEEEDYGEVTVVREGVDDVGDFDCCY